MLTPGLPYALAPSSFRFPALAAAAGRMPLGAGREVALAAVLAGRLAVGALPGSGLSQSVRATRATAAAHWLGATCPDARVRAACVRVVAASAEDDAAAITAALGRLVELLTPTVPADARAELLALIEAFFRPA